MMTGMVINNRYKILKEIGKGGMGKVFLAEDRLYENNHVALKVLHQLVYSERKILSFKKEFEIMVRLKHPNLVRVFDFEKDREKNKYFFTMEYIPGQSLEDIITTHSIELSPERKISVMIHLCRALEFIHSRQILHRDVKPGNVIISDDKVMVMDFGLADLEAASGGQKKGTVLYAAPEIFRGSFDYRGDIFSLGITFYELLTHTHFYQELTHVRIKEIIENNEVFDRYKIKRLANLPSMFADLLNAMITYHPENRFTHCVEVLNAINRLCSKSYAVETESTKKSYILSPVFVGRQEEVSKLQQWLEMDTEQALLIYGEPGVGKSRLMHEFKIYCQINNIIFIESNCHLSITQAFSGITPLINYCLYNAPYNLVMHYGAELKKIYPDHDVLADIEVNKQYNAGVEKNIIINAFANFLLDCITCFENRAAFYINDLQWADMMSVEIFNNVLMKVAHKRTHGENMNRFNLFFSCRENGLKTIIKAFDKERLVVVKLYPFDMVTMERYIYAIFGEDRLERNLKYEMVNNKLGGNPFYLQEYIRSMVDKGGIVRNNFYWELTESITRAADRTNIEELIITRLHNTQLNTEETYILQVLALLDREITYEELNKIIPVDNDDLRLLVDNELLQAKHDKNKVYYEFYHEIIRETVFNQIENPEELHASIGNRLETLYHDYPVPYYDELAYHFSNSAQKEKAVMYLEKSADDAKAKYDNVKALLSYDKLLSMLDDTEYEKIGKVLIKEGEIYHIFSDMTKCKQVLLRADTILQKIDDRTNRARLYVLLARMSNVGDHAHEALEYLQKAYTLYDAIGDTSGLAYVLNTMGASYLRLHEYDKAIECHNRSIELAEALNDRLLIGFNIGNKGNIYISKGDYDNALACFNHVLKMVIDEGNKQYIAMGYGSVADTYLRMKQYEKAVEFYDKSLDMAKEIESHDTIAESLINKVEALIDLNKPDNLKNMIVEGLYSAKRAGMESMVFKANILLVRLEYINGNYDKAQTKLNHLLDQTTGETNIARLYYELWRITKDATQKEQTLRLLKEVYAKIKEYEFKEYIDELEGKG